MKISKLFHSLYATLMFLPVMVIPIFAININQKSVEPIQIEVQEEIAVDFNQLVENGDFENNTKWQSNGSNMTINDNYCEFTANYRYGGITNYFNETIVNRDVLYLSCYVQTTIENNAIQFLTQDSYGTTTQVYSSSTTNIQRLEVVSRTDRNNTRNVNIRDNSTSNWQPVKVFSVMIINLTQMYGDGNEPTLQEFQTQFDNSYYDYTLSQKMLVNKPTTTIYNDTDIGSQFLYTLYIPVHDYFNIVNWMNLGGLYDWFLLNIFNGVNALVLEIIFNLIIYWLMVSFVWLIFDVLMYVPSMIHKMLDKARME